MEETQPASPADRIRLSDAERDAALSRLQTAFAAGWITAPEFDERFEQVRHAKVRAELTDVLCDLPAEPARSASRGPARAPGSPAMPGRQRISFALLGVRRYRGQWVVPPGLTLVAVAGAVVVDLRNASFAGPDAVIRAYGVLGVLRVIVPEGVGVAYHDEIVAGPADVAGIRPEVRIVGGGLAGLTVIEVDPMAPPWPRRRSLRPWVIRIR